VELSNAFTRTSIWGLGHVDAPEVVTSAWIDEQFGTPASPISDVPPNANGTEPMGPVQQEFFYNAVNGADQLRQRVAFALGEIWVVSAVKLTTADQMVPYLRLLSADAFADYYTIAHDVTLSPSMGHYLDMVNNDKPNAATGRSADENYARELMQLFTLGLNELNPDGSVKLAGGQPVPTYDQDTIEALADIFTGWTYPVKPGATAASHNPAYFDGAMVAVAANHDTSAQTLFGVTLAAGQTAEQELAGALHSILNHPNVAPFVSRQLIQHLVTGNPSAAYVARVAQAFQNSNGDMKTVIRAILLDSEARAGDGPAVRFADLRQVTLLEEALPRGPRRETATRADGFGHLREPVLYINALLRGLGATVTATNSLPAQGATLGQNGYYPPTVFNYFSPQYSFTEQTAAGPVSVNAPEFQILSTSTALLRTGFVNTLAYGTLGGVTLDWTPYAGMTGEAVTQAIVQALLGGRFSSAAAATVTSGVSAQTTDKARAQAAVYLIATSSQYQVER